jgi:hypothetical protein
MDTTKLVQDNIDKLVAFRDDLRQPKVVFGRCALTGEWGKCISLDLGDVSIQAPDTERGVEVDSETGTVKFTYWKPAIFENQATLSEAGLKKILDYLDSQENPIPGLCPDLVYKWQAMYTDGTVLSQFQMVDNVEQEVISTEIDFTRVAQFSVTPRYSAEDVLPTYTLVKETGQIYKAGVELNLMYEGEYRPDAEIVYARKITHTWGSQIQGLNRDITNTHTSVLQLLGWKIGGLKGPGPGFIIAIDERGHWRPWEYIS